jgi:hypothetical protein
MMNRTGHTEYGKPAGLIIRNTGGNKTACRNNGMEVVYVLR